MDKLPAFTVSEQRLRLADAVAQMAVAIENGACDPTLAELKAIAAACDAQHLHVEAARVRRWMGL